MFKYLIEYEGKNVEICVRKTDDSVTTFTGKITAIRNQGTGIIFIELDNKKLLNVRYIISIETIN